MSVPIHESLITPFHQTYNDGLLTVRSTKADFVSILTCDAAAFEEICVTSLKIFVLIQYFKL